MKEFQIYSSTCVIKLISRITDINNSNLLKQVCSYRKQCLREYYYDFFREKIDYWNSKDEQAISEINSTLLPIWVCWLQGIDELPNELGYFLDLIYRHSGRHKVLFVDYTDILHLVNIPAEIQELFVQGKMKPAHFCDYARCKILEKYGGLWIDPSVLVTKDFPDDIFCYPMWSVKGLKHFPYEAAIPDARNWQIYVLAGQKRASFFTAFCDFFEYCLYSNIKYDYFVSYYISDLLRKNVKCISQSYSIVPNNNSFCERLQIEFSKNNNLKFFLNSDTYLFKFSRQALSKKYIDIINELS